MQKSNDREEQRRDQSASQFKVAFHAQIKNCCLHGESLRALKVNGSEESRFTLLYRGKDLRYAL